MQLQFQLLSFFHSFHTLMIYPLLVTFILANLLPGHVVRVASVHAETSEPVVKIDETLIKLPLSANINKNYAKNLLENDRARIRALIQNSMRQTTSHSPVSSSTSTKLKRAGSPGDVLAVNNAVQYTIVVDIGNPPTQYNLLIDTGSSNTWVGANKAYVRTSTSLRTRNNVSVTYGSGEFSGMEYLDQVALGSTLIVRNQSIGVATEYQFQGFDGIDGILGLGPVDLTVGTLSPDSSRGVATVVQKLFAQKSIPHDSFSVFFAPTNSTLNVNGELTFGGIDSRQIVGNVTYTSIPTQGAASTFWGLRQSIVYGNSKEIVSNAAGFYDTGTTLILLDDNAFDAYVASTNSSLDPVVGLLEISEDQYSNLQSLYFIVNNTKFELTRNAQIWPRSLNTAIGGTEDKIYLVVSSLGSAANGAPDVQFVNGYSFLERFYTTYDILGRRIGIAPTEFTYAETN